MKHQTNKSVIDTSKMSAGQRAALEATEAARESQFDERSSIAAGYFMGRPDFGRVSPFPEQSVEDRDHGGPFVPIGRPFLQFGEKPLLLGSGDPLLSNYLLGMGEIGHRRFWSVRHGVGKRRRRRSQPHVGQ